MFVDGRKADVCHLVHLTQTLQNQLPQVRGGDFSGRLAFHNRLILNIVKDIFDHIGRYGTFFQSALNAFFQSVTLRTAGFNSFDLSGLRDGSELFSSLLMMIGASPASTGGGIKTTTIATLTLLMLSVIRGESEVNVARRRLSDDIVGRALAVTGLFMIVLLTGTLMISFIEGERFPLEDVLFEASSAMGTVGVSAIGTPNLSAASQAVLLPMMFLGRVGPLTLAVAMAKRQGNIKSSARYPEERIMIG